MAELKQIWIHAAVHKQIKRECKEERFPKQNISDRASQLITKGIEAEANERKSNHA